MRMMTSIFGDTAKGVKLIRLVKIVVYIIKDGWENVRDGDDWVV